MDIEKAIDCLKADKEYLTDMKICDGEEMDIAIANKVDSAAFLQFSDGIVGSVFSLTISFVTDAKPKRVNNPMNFVPHFLKKLDALAN